MTPAPIEPTVREGEVAQPTAAVDRPVLPPWASWTIMLGVGLAIWLVDVGLDARPQKIDARGWRLLAVFVPTILGLVLRPIAGGAIVLLSLITTVLVAALSIEQALKGYASKTVWLVLAAFFIARALIKTGLAKRIALTFVRLLGRNTLGVGYAMVATDTVLGAMIPSNAARVGGVILPVTRSIAELYKSYPGRSAALLGSFLMLTIYQGDIVACALHFTGQASNPIAAEHGNKTGELAGTAWTMNYANWLLAAVVPGLASLLIVPWLVYRWNRPEITHTPEATAFARAELEKMGRPAWDEWVVITVLLGVCTFWIVVPDQAALVSLVGAGALLVSGVLTWDDAVRERGAWDVFIWYGGLVLLGEELYNAKVTAVFAGSVADNLGGVHWMLMFLAIFLIYFYIHYAFASITTHIVSMYPAFIGVLIAAGAPPALTCYAFAFASNLCAGLTNYGTTPAPIVFNAGYVSHGTWWRIGFLLSLVNITIWLTVGMVWWKVLGLW